MPYINCYRPNPPLERADWHAQTPLEEYDLNFVFDLPPRLETGGVRLEPVIPSIHAPQLYRLFSAYPDTLTYLPYGPFADYTSFLTFLEMRRRHPNWLMFAVYDLGLEFDDGVEEDFAVDGGGLRPERIAGVVGLITTPDFRMAELGPLHLANCFQRTHVMTHSIWLLLDWIFASPTGRADPRRVLASTSSPPPPPKSPRGLGLRRAQWGANAGNTASINAAQRIGFTLETPHATWERPLKHESKGGRIELPAFVKADAEWYDHERAIGWGRDSALLGMGWDTWHEKGGRSKVWQMVQRGVVRRKASEVPDLLEIASRVYK
ncbi:hypothetical protein JCM10908_005470 [Rhodotorula pacifica]|uniref:uncharacterized protein n=1 Tax=Rhodotorula pacifica TaxID=1495444 RepID=UPI00317AFB60